MTAAAPLAERITAALKGGASAGVAELIAEVEAAIADAQNRSAEAKERALDPLLSADEIAAARKDSEDALFEAERMVRAAKVLRETLIEFQAAEEEADRSGVYETAVARRREVAARLREEYPGLVNQLGALFAEIVSVDAMIARANQAMPSSGARLEAVEIFARPDGERLAPRGGPYLVDTRLQALDAGESVPPVWGKGLTAANSDRAFRPDITHAAPAASDPVERASTTGGAVLQRPASPVVPFRKETAA